MDTQQQAAYVISQAACASIEAMALNAANYAAGIKGDPVPHEPKDFLALIEKYGIHHNAVLTAFGR